MRGFQYRMTGLEGKIVGGEGESCQISSGYTFPQSLPESELPLVIQKLSPFRSPALPNFLPAQRPPRINQHPKHLSSFVILTIDGCSACSYHPLAALSEGRVPPAVFPPPPPPVATLQSSGRPRAPGVEAAREGGGLVALPPALPQADRGSFFAKSKPPPPPTPPPLPGAVVVRLASRLDRARARLAIILRASGLRRQRGGAGGQERVSTEVGWAGRCLYQREETGLLADCGKILWKSMRVRKWDEQVGVRVSRKETALLADCGKTLPRNKRVVRHRSRCF